MNLDVIMRGSVMTVLNHVDMTDILKNAFTNQIVYGQNLVKENVPSVAFFHGKNISVNQIHIFVDYKIVHVLLIAHMIRVQINVCQITTMQYAKYLVK